MAIENQIDYWVQRLRAIAQIGLAFHPPVYDRERYEELLELASHMAATRADLSRDEILSDALYAKWRSEVQSGVPGYVTPKVGVGAAVFNDRAELLLIERPSGYWLFPTGWADVGYTPAQVAAKEVREETGLDVTPTRLVAVYDIRNLAEHAMQMHFYSLVFYCRLNGGEIRVRPHEALQAKFFAREHLPSPLAHPELGWVEHVFAAHYGELPEPYFDTP
ncbi:NUDIX domain-containing protein [Anaerolineae bacterium CFX7]|nr:NUDIX domain-containing protein [Anaerolineae bacterium CFX7]